MTSSEANDVATPAFNRDGKSVYEILDYLWDTVHGDKAVNRDTNSSVTADTSLSDLEKRVAQLEQEVGVPTPEDIVGADTGKPSTGPDTGKPSTGPDTSVVPPVPTSTDSSGGVAASA